MRDLQNKLLDDLKKRGVTAEQIKNTKNINNPYPVNGRYIWYLSKGIIKGKHTESAMICFFADLENKLIETKND